MNSWLAQLNHRLRAELPDLPEAENDEAGFLELQKGIARLVPASFREFLLWRPRGVTVNFHWELPGSSGGQLLDQEDFLIVLEAWKKPGPPGTTNWWNSLWFPLLGCQTPEGAYSYFCLDLEGSFGNPAASMLQHKADSPERPVLFPHFEGWLRWLATALDQGVGRLFWEDLRLDIVIQAKGAALHREMFPNYPIQGATEMLGVGLLDQVLNLLPRGGLQLGPQASLPQGLSLQAIQDLLLHFPVRQDGLDEDCVRIVFTTEVAGQSLTHYANLAPGPQGVILKTLTSLPENAAFAVRSALTMVERGQMPVAASRLNEAAFLAFRGRALPEARVLVERALELDPENAVAKNSLAALELKRVVVDPQRLRPLMRHIGSGLKLHA